MTLSGGEPLAQPEFAAELLATAKREGLHTCIETSGGVPWRAFEAVLGTTDLFLYDLKDTDPGRHRQATGMDLEPILETLRHLHAAGAGIRLRLPVIPDWNDRPEHFAAVARLLTALPGIKGPDRLPHHPLGRGKDAALA